MICLAGLLILPRAAKAGNPLEGAKAAGMGTAFLAVADDPSAIAHNPAGLTQQKGTHIYNGINAVILSSEYESPEGRSERTSFQIFLPPNAFLTTDFGLEKVALGLGIYSPFGIGGRKWSETGLTRYASTNGLIATVNINPTVAWRVLPQLSLGFGVDILYSLNQMAKMVDQSALGFRDAKLSFRGDGVGVGGNFGILLFPNGEISLAFAYRSRIRLRQRGSVALEAIAPPLQPPFGGGVFRTNASIVMEFPHTFNWGLAWRPTSKMTLALDVEWFRWSVLKQQVLNLKNEIPAVHFTDIPLIFDWQDCVLLKVGVDYKISERFSLRGGYTYLPTVVPDRTLNPGNPDSDQHYLAMGFGYRTGKWVIDVSYVIGFYVDRKADNTILSGAYHSLSHASGVSIGYRF